MKAVGYPNGRIFVINTIAGIVMLLCPDGKADATGVLGMTAADGGQEDLFTRLFGEPGRARHFLVSGEDGFPAFPAASFFSFRSSISFCDSARDL